MSLIVFRPAEPADAGAIASVYLSSRRIFLPYAPLAHTDPEVRQWVAQRLLPESDVTVALLAGRIAGFMALTRRPDSGWIDQLYLHPDFVGRGIGSQFVDQAKKRFGSPIRLYTFQANRAARRFYERYGFKPIRFSDGAGNEEHCPDVLYEWRE